MWQVAGVGVPASPHSPRAQRRPAPALALPGAGLETPLPSRAPPDLALAAAPPAPPPPLSSKELHSAGAQLVSPPGG